MTSPVQEPSSSREFVKQSSLYQEFLAEREEILKHKWLESERLGYDIGFERALLDWIRKHREGWRAARRQQSPPPIGWLVNAVRDCDGQEAELNSPADSER